MNWKLPKLPARKIDKRRQELSDLISNSENVPRSMRYMAHMAVARMSEDDLTRALAIARDVTPLVEAGDMDGVRAVLRASEIPDELIGVAERMLDAGNRN